MKNREMGVAERPFLSTQHGRLEEQGDCRWCGGDGVSSQQEGGSIVTQLRSQCTSTQWLQGAPGISSISPDPPSTTAMGSHAGAIWH